MSSDLFKAMTEGQQGLVDRGIIRLHVVEDTGMICATNGKHVAYGRTPRLAIEKLGTA